MTSQTYEALNRMWKPTSKVVFGEEIGELSGYEGWLAEGIPSRHMRRSGLSGKEVSFVLPHYPDTDGSRFASLDEVDYSRKFEPLGINEIKDIDSIAEAVRERVCYTGNITLGNSMEVEGSTEVTEGFHIYNSAEVAFSKYIAYGYCIEYGECVFGSMNHSYCNHSVKVNDSDYLSRCFEIYGGEECQDSYYSHRLFNCRNCLFCFNQRSVSNAIGNLELPQDKYLALKKKLLAEMAGELRKNKRLPTLLEIVGSSEPDLGAVRKAAQKARKPEAGGTSTAEIKDAFRKTTGVVFGRQLEGPGQYERWLGQYPRKTRHARSVISGDDMVVADQSHYYRYPAGRLVTDSESLALGKELKIASEDLSYFGLRSAGRWIGKIAFFHPGLDFGENSNVIDSTVNISVVNCFRTTLTLHSRNIAYSYYVEWSDSVFGCNLVRKSSFLLRCCASTYLTRSLEVDSSRNCSDAYFLHNCENVRDSMFCFNAKNLHSAIGNSPLPPEQYRKVKVALLAQMADELERNKELKWDIYNIGCAK